MKLSRKKAQEKTAKLFFNILRYAFFISFSFVILYPFIYIICNAVKGNADFMDPMVQWIPKHFNLNNFVTALKAFDVQHTIVNTLIYEIVPALIQFCACAVAAYGLARFEFRGKNLLMGMMILNILVPSMMLMTPTYVNYSRMDFLGIFGLISKAIGQEIRPNLINTPFVTYLPAVLGMGIRGGFFIFIYLQFFRKFPKELEEAACIDGAGPWRTFLQIVVPDMGAAAITVFLFTMVWHWNDYYEAQMFLSDHPTFAVSLNSYTINTISNVLEVSMTTVKYLAVPTLMAGCFLFILPLIALYIAMQKKFVASVSNSGITG
ncbi:MAG: carbohydrate ABC transporter permease [Faecalimonas sp.]|nr:carbohydrate ABC transporter permease [Faecalimonas sp.]